MAPPDYRVFVELRHRGYVTRRQFLLRGDDVVLPLIPTDAPAATAEQARALALKSGAIAGGLTGKPYGQPDVCFGGDRWWVFLEGTQWTGGEWLPKIYGEVDPVTGKYALRRCGSQGAWMKVEKSRGDVLKLRDQVTGATFECPAKPSPPEACRAPTATLIGLTTNWRPHEACGAVGSTTLLQLSHTRRHGATCELRGCKRVR